jgi:hypothetical protein
MLRKSFVCIWMWIMLMGAVVAPQSLYAQCITPPSGMVAWWPLDETSSPANDLAGVNNVGTWMNNPTPVSGKVAGALCFDGFNDYVEVQNHSELNFGTGDLTIDAWVKRDTASTPSPPSVIVDKRDPSVIGYSLSVSYGRLGFQMSGTNYYTTTSPVPADGLWHHVAVTVNRVTNVVQFYSDGFLLNTLPFTQPPGNLDNANPFWIGKGQLGGNQPWRGCIDELEIFNRVLDSLEVRSIWAADSLGKCKPVRNHYKTWRIQPQTFDRTVFVQDQFMEDSLRLVALEFLSNPVKKVVQNDTFNIIRPNDHLTWYRAVGRDTLLEVEYVNQFESTTVSIDFVKYLLVPTQKQPHAPPESLDHYKAYRIKDPVAFDAPTLLEDQFDSLYGSPEFIYMLKPIYFLTPSLKNMPPPMFDSITHYVAYEIFPNRFFPIPVNTFDQFGSHVLQVDTSKILLVPTKKLGVTSPETLVWYWKPPYPDYAPSGMPDVDQKQDNWKKLGTGQWTFCGPVAVANCFKWFDSKYNVPPGGPGDGIDMFPLVRDYLDENPPLVGFDDHDPWNVDHVNTPWNPPAIPSPPSTPQPFVPGPQPPNQVPSWGELVERLAWYFNTDGIRSGYCAFSGTKVNQMEDGISQWFLSEHFPNGSTLADTLCEVTLKAPTFAKVESLVKKCEDVILLLGFWWHDGTRWRRSGGHYVTVAGVNSDQLQIAFSDPFFDNAEMGGAGRVGSGMIIPHTPGHYPTVHNDEGNVSHDIYDVTGSPSPGGVWGLPGYPVSLNPSYSDSFSGQNTPDEFFPDTGTWNGVDSIYTEVEYAVHISPWDYRGDVTSDSVGDASDIVYLINYLFVGGPAPNPYSEGDVTCDGIIDITDLVFLLNYVFINGPEPRCCDP